MSNEHVLPPGFGNDPMSRALREMMTCRLCAEKDAEIERLRLGLRNLISAARALAADGKARRSLGTNCDGRGHSCPYRAAIDAIISRAENVAGMAEALSVTQPDQHSSTSPAPCAHAADSGEARQSEDIRSAGPEAQSSERRGSSELPGVTARRDGNGNRGQRYEITVFDECREERIIIGWTDTESVAMDMARAADSRQAWKFARVRDRHDTSASTKEV